MCCEQFAAMFVLGLFVVFICCLILCFFDVGCIVCILFSISMVLAAEAKYMSVLLYVSTLSVTDLC